MKLPQLIWVLILVWLFAAPAFAKPPEPFTGVVVAVSDGDTYTVKRSDGDTVRVRLHYADAPEVAHNSHETSQPLGGESKAFAARRLLGKSADVKPAGQSYDRIVADVTTDQGDDMAKALEQAGLAMLDRRFKPPASLVAAEDLAKQNKRGVWAADNPTPPWEWRQRQRAKRTPFTLLLSR